AGRQIELLGKSVWIRYMELFGQSIALPEDGYQGDYVKDIAVWFKEQYQDQYVQDLDQKVIQFFSEKSASIILEGMKEDLNTFAVRFDRFFSETEFRKTPEVEHCLAYLKEHQFIYEHDGAVWFRSSDYGDDKDRVLVRSNGQQTYFCPDIAYHRNKLSRGFDRLIDIWGPDHHGYIPRMRAALRALGLDEEAFDVIILQLATLYEGDTKLSMSTRKGEFVSLRQIIEEVGMEVARYFFLMRRTDSHLDFDLALAKKHSMDNPVYYIQYAYARIASIFREYQNSGGDFNKAPQTLNVQDPEGLEMIKLMGMYPDVLENSAAQLQPNILTDYLQKLAGAFHSFYAKCRVLTEDQELSMSRLRLIQAVQIIIKNGFSLLGISAPESM
ncbi:MAG: arginine--tRNA ligase, partial [Chlamydiota bacterium]|nr:arginine--tRNA ligase [Chlamydiota bacterium]